jgi:glycosyltransferase involved in cell wall biosynthesis
MSKHILIVADGRSPTTISWIRNIQALDFAVSLLSTFPCDPPPDIKHFHILPVALSHFSSGGRPPSDDSSGNQQKSWIKHFRPRLQKLRYFLGPISLHLYVRKYRQFVKSINPDLVHALRIPFEGMMASRTPKGTPVVAATWGNDLTLHANGSCLMRKWTRRCLARAEGLISDTHRDIHLAGPWGLAPCAVTLKVPGSGGLNLRTIQDAKGFDPEQYHIPPGKHWVVNPRGIRPGSVHQDVFIKAIPKVLEVQPDTFFICPSLADSNQIQKQVSTLGLENHVFLLPKLPQAYLWSLLKQASIFVSPSSHDGTPNSLLEAMACGCFPVTGNIESMREWILDGKNGLLVNPRDPDELASAIIKALEQPEHIVRAAAHNQSLIKSTAADSVTHPKIKAFYEKLMSV